MATAPYVTEGTVILNYAVQDPLRLTSLAGCSCSGPTKAALRRRAAVFGRLSFRCCVCADERDGGARAPVIFGHGPGSNCRHRKHHRDRNYGDRTVAQLAQRPESNQSGAPNP